MNVNKNIALIGLPNSGKSTLFNALTRSRQRVANFPGITVEKKEGFFRHENQLHRVIDLPGIYTLDVNTIDEKVSRDYVFDKIKDEKASLFVVVMDATNIKKSLYLALQLKELEKKFVLVLNMIDQADKRGLVIDVEELTKIFSTEVFLVSALEQRGVDQLKQFINKPLSADKVVTFENYQQKIKQPQYIKNKLDQIDLIVNKVIKTPISRDTFTDKLDNLIMHPLWGSMILVGTLVFMFQVLFLGAEPFIGLIEDFFDVIKVYATDYITHPRLESLVVDGIINGIGSVLVFLPHIIFLFLIIYFLEDFGYLGRAAFLLDFIMRKLGLPGKAVVPLLSSHACAIPGIMSARILDNPRERLITMLVSPLTTCSARLPVYTLVIAATIPNQKVFGFLALPGLVLFILYFMGIMSAFMISFILKKTLPKTSPSYLMMELPPYRMPRLKDIIFLACSKGWMFIKKAGTIIFLLTILLWFLISNPVDKDGRGDVESSYAASIGKTFEPIFKPLGFDWRMTTALIPSFAAREVFVSSLATVMSVEARDEDEQVEDLRALLRSEFSFASLMALLAWFIYAPQCISTIAILKKETNSYQWPVMFGLYTLALAYVVSFIVFSLFS